MRWLGGSVRQDVFSKTKGGRVAITVLTHFFRILRPGADVSVCQNELFFRVGDQSSGPPRGTAMSGTTPPRPARRQR